MAKGDPCTRCKGGKVTVTVKTVSRNPEERKNDGKFEMNCLQCDGTGIDQGHVYVEDLVKWCRCKTIHPSDFVDDGPCKKCKQRDPRLGGRQKHHYHCSWCGGVTQIG